MINFYIGDLPDNVKFNGSVAIDTEAMGLIIGRDRLCLVQMCSADGNVYIVQINKNQENLAVNLKNILIDSNVLKIFHFARFDVAILNHAFGINVSSIYCTKIASKLARTYTDKHGLKNLCKDVLGVEISKQEQSSDWGNAKLSKEQLKYAANDVIYLHAIRDKLNCILEREGNMQLAKECFECIPLIVRLDLSNVDLSSLFDH